MATFIQTQDVVDVGWGIGILFICLMVVWLLYRALLGRAKRSRPRLGTQILGSIAGPIMLLIVVEGIYVALSLFPQLRGWRDILWRANLAFAVVLATHSLARVIHILMSWYAQTVAARTETSLDDTFTPFLRRILMLAIYVGGVLILLDTIGITIAPMLTGLGLGGLAVALALQPTLTSFFAGLQVITDQVVSVGDFVELDIGVQGYVVEVGWRSTRIRSTHQNLTVVPNSRLVESVITNYDSPHREVAIIVEAGVSYSSNLAQVEKVALDVTREVIEELPEAVKDREPWFGFDTFGDSNINFWVWHYATDYIGTFRLKSELIKRLHARFEQEGIEINYPVRKLIYECTPQKNKNESGS